MKEASLCLHAAVQIMIASALIVHINWGYGNICHLCNAVAPEVHSFDDSLLELVRHFFANNQQSFAEFLKVRYLWNE